MGSTAMKLSIIIANYNYRDYVGAAIESALAVDWPDKEVIVGRCGSDGRANSGRRLDDPKAARSLQDAWRELGLNNRVARRIQIATVAASGCREGAVVFTD